MGRRQRGTIGEHWDPRKLRRVREDGWFRQHEPELIAAARRRRAPGAVVNGAGVADAAKPGSGPKPSSEYDEALRRAHDIVARAMDLIRDVDRAHSADSK